MHKRMGILFSWSVFWLLRLAPVWGENVSDLERALARVGTIEQFRGEWKQHTNYALAALALKRAKLLQQGGFWGDTETALQKIVASGLRALQRLEKGQPPVVQAGALNEFAYITENDLTAQPYYVYVPENYQPQRPWPLIVFLHGYVPTITVLDPWLPAPEHCAVAGKHGCLLLVPYGRRNTDFQGVGEIDVLATIELVKQAFHVDAERIYLSGVSMGGMGAWNLALRHPGMFAAVTPICGHTDMFLWWGWPREETYWWKRWLIEWDNAIDQTPNLRNQNFFVQHGELDNLIPVTQSRLLVQAAEKQGTPIKYYEHPGQSHFIYFNTETYERAWSWQKQFRLAQSPQRVDFKLYSLEYNRAFWLTVEALEQWGRPGFISAEASLADKTLTIRSENIAAVTIDTRQAGLPPVCRVIWNSKSLGELNPDKEGKLHLPLSFNEHAGNTSQTPSLWRKRRGLCGPCEEVFDTRFLVVQGTAGDEAADTILAQQVSLWAKEWDEFADGYPLIKTDREITEEDIQKCNLVLFGTPQTNAILARLADALPIQIGDHRYEINGKVFAGPDLGLVMCYPNPLNPSRYVLIYSGERYGERLSINHKHDLLPDFIIFTTKEFGRDNANQALCAGFFDMKWQLDPDLIWEQAAQ